MVISSQGKSPKLKKPPVVVWVASCVWSLQAENSNEAPVFNVSPALKIPSPFLSQYFLNFGLKVQGGGGETTKLSSQTPSGSS